MKYDSARSACASLWPPVRKAFPAHGEGAPVRTLGRMRSFCRTTGRPRCARRPHQSAALTASPCEGKPEPRIKASPCGGRRMRCCPVFPSRAKPWQCGTLWGGTTPPSSGGRNTLDDTSPCAGEVFGLLRASRRARNARRSKLCSAPTAKTGAQALAGATPPAVGAAACPRPAAAFFFK